MNVFTGVTSRLADVGTVISRCGLGASALRTRIGFSERPHYALSPHNRCFHAFPTFQASLNLYFGRQAYVPIGLSATITVTRRATIAGIRRLRQRKPSPHLRVSLAHRFGDICRRGVALFGLENRPPTGTPDTKDKGVHSQAVAEQRAQKRYRPT